MSAFLSEQMSWKIGNYRNGRAPKAGEMQKEMNEDVAHTSPLCQGDIYVVCVIYSSAEQKEMMRRPAINPRRIGDISTSPLCLSRTKGLSSLQLLTQLK
jgi:hypothetical protein